MYKKTMQTLQIMYRSEADHATPFLSHPHPGARRSALALSRTGVFSIGLGQKEGQAGKTAFFNIPHMRVRVVCGVGVSQSVNALNTFVNG